MKRMIPILIIMQIALMAGCDELNIEFYEDGKGPKTPKTNNTETRAPSKTANHLALETVDGSMGEKTKGATEIALAWAERYSQLTKEHEIVRRRNYQLEKQTKLHQSQMNEAAKKLQDAMRELDDANKMLEEMKGELKEWRANVLGFRKEMMASQAAQLGAMKRILVMLGAEVTSQPKVILKPKGTGESK